MLKNQHMHIWFQSCWWLTRSAERMSRLGVNPASFALSWISTNNILLDAFQTTNTESFGPFFTRVLNLRNSDKLSMRERLFYLTFIINCFQSLETKIVRDQCLRYVYNWRASTRADLTQLLTADWCPCNCGTHSMKNDVNMKWVTWLSCSACGRVHRVRLCLLTASDRVFMLLFPYLEKAGDEHERGFMVALIQDYNTVLKSITSKQGKSRCRSSIRADNYFLI